MLTIFGTAKLEVLGDSNDCLFSPLLTHPMVLFKNKMHERSLAAQVQ